MSHRIHPAYLTEEVRSFLLEIDSLADLAKSAERGGIDLDAVTRDDLMRFMADPALKDLTSTKERADKIVRELVQATGEDVKTVRGRLSKLWQTVHGEQPKKDADFADDKKSPLAHVRSNEPGKEPEKKEPEAEKKPEPAKPTAKPTIEPPKKPATAAPTGHGAPAPAGDKPDTKADIQPVKLPVVDKHAPTTPSAPHTPSAPRAQYGQHTETGDQAFADAVEDVYHRLTGGSKEFDPKESSHSFGPWSGRAIEVKDFVVQKHPRGLKVDVDIEGPGHTIQAGKADSAIQSFARGFATFAKSVAHLRESTGPHRLSPDLMLIEAPGFLSKNREWHLGGLRKGPSAEILQALLGALNARGDIESTNTGSKIAKIPLGNGVELTDVDLRKNGANYQLHWKLRLTFNKSAADPRAAMMKIAGAVNKLDNALPR